MTLSNTNSITLQELEPRVMDLKKQNYRLMTLTPLDFGDELEIIYQFDKDLETVGLRLRVPRGQRLKSISKHYFAAFLVENEIQDLFRVTFDDLIIDYKGHIFVQEEVRNMPYGQIQVRKKTREQGDK